ncbi:MAG: hypothetical protein QW270_00135 [Candidatus Bathyarchaeia archaeon]
MFEDNYKKKLERLLKLYYNVKSLIIYTEEISRETYPQILLEQRDTLDHIMRALNRLMEAKLSDEDAEYILTNLDKAYAHLYRAGYDALDWAGVTLRDLIGEQLIDITPPTITQVFPEYYREIKPKILEISEKIAKLRETKDIGAPNLDSFNEYLKLIEELKGYYEKIIKIRSSLIEVEKHSRKNVIKKCYKILGANCYLNFCRRYYRRNNCMVSHKIHFNFRSNSHPYTHSHKTQSFWHCHLLSKVLHT